MTAATLPSSSLLSLEDALARMLDGVEPLPVISQPPLAAMGLILAEPLVARHTLPPWDNSAMDGFAVRAIDVASAEPVAGVRLTVVGEAAAGHPPTAAVGAGTAVRILTGAPMPSGADAVVPVEDTDVDPGLVDLPQTVEIRRAVPTGAHVRSRGSDVMAGTTLLRSGCTIGPAEAAIAAAGGHAALPVHRRPRVAVLATGDELAEPGSELEESQIPDSNSTGLLAQAMAVGAEAIALGISRDRLPDVVAALRRGMERADVVVVSGGVSVGAHDVVKEAFSELGRLELWRVAVQPGKPLAFARAGRDGEGPPAVLFGLPGNPVSSFVTFELFVRPVLARLAGHLSTPARETVSARLAEPVTKSPGRRAFLRVRLTAAAGEWHASLAGGQGSHVLSALAAADGLAVVPEDVAGLPAGASVEVILLRRPAADGN
ncbi:MAG TPA: gephyrin-like molybdotransferase Glp [Candidatus Limnocylindrales bacterium]|nr:gephyrin-like molybdotransferase Glp [Candidatus Limnocylindrales bacterium]